MKFWRIWAMVLAVCLMVGEAVRTWGLGRSLPSVLDDFVAGGALLTTAYLMGRPTPGRLCAFAAVLGGTFVGATFSVLMKVTRPSVPVESNINVRMLIVLIGLVALSCLVAIIACVRFANRAYAAK
jgi:hypothetical protein